MLLVSWFFLTSAPSAASPLLDFACIAPLLGVSFGSANSPSLLAVRPDHHQEPGLREFNSPTKLVFVAGLATASSEDGGRFRRLGASLNPDISFKELI